MVHFCPLLVGPSLVGVPGTWSNICIMPLHSFSHHLKLSFQLKPPQVISLAVMYSKLSSEITSITGHTTAFRLAAGQNKFEMDPIIFLF